MDTLLSAAQDLMDKILEQVFVIPADTLSQCPNCHVFSKDGKTCDACLVVGLGYIVGKKRAQAFHAAAVNLRESTHEVLRMATTETSNGKS